MTAMATPQTNISNGQEQSKSNCVSKTEQREMNKFKVLCRKSVPDSEFFILFPYLPFLPIQFFEKVGNHELIA